MPRTKPKTRGLKGKFVIPLQNTTQQPLLLSLADRDMREKLFNSRWTRDRKGRRQRHPRHHRRAGRNCAREKAKLLGYPNYAAYVLYDQMANTPDKVEKFLGQLVRADRAPRPPTKPS